MIALSAQINLNVKSIVGWQGFMKLCTEIKEKKNNDSGDDIVGIQSYKANIYFENCKEREAVGIIKSICIDDVTYDHLHIDFNKLSGCIPCTGYVLQENIIGIKNENKGGC